MCKSCSYSISRVIAAEPNCIEVLELGSLPHLTKILSSTETVIRSYAVLCLAAMIKNGTINV